MASGFAKATCLALPKAASRAAARFFPIPEMSSSTERLFLLSRAEVGFNVNDVPYKDEVDPNAENVTFALFTDNNSRIKKTYNGTGSASNWWLRSPEASGSSSFAVVYYFGYSNYYYAASNSYGVAFGFCI